MEKQIHIIVVGAGAFGGWTALYLKRGGARVTLLDSWGPGNSRASSGGETRVIRSTYGPNQPYTRLAARATQLWKEHQSTWNRQFFFPLGVLWMMGGDGAYAQGSIAPLQEAGVKFEELAVKEMEQRWPQINFDGVESGVYEPNSGYLLARASAQAVVEHFIAEGGEYRQQAVDGKHLEAKLAEPIIKESKTEVRLLDGSQISADRVIFACGPWMGELFPQAIGPHFVSTRQEIFFFGTPAGETRFNAGNVPVWGDQTGHFMYGIPGNQERGFKLADDTRGPQFDPTYGDRLVSQEGIENVRSYLAYRFPGMKDAPLLESRVCQYENTSDENFIIDRHPSNQSIWMVGGGSGHGFKHGPALGEMVAKLVLQDEEAEPIFRLARFNAKTKLSS